MGGEGWAAGPRPREGETPWLDGWTCLFDEHDPLPILTCLPLPLLYPLLLLFFTLWHCLQIAEWVLNSRNASRVRVRRHVSLDQIKVHL